MARITSASSTGRRLERCGAHISSRLRGSEIFYAIHGEEISFFCAHDSDHLCQSIVNMRAAIPNSRPFTLSRTGHPLLTSEAEDASIPLFKLEEMHISGFSSIHASPSSNLVLKLPGLTTRKYKHMPKILLEDGRAVQEAMPGPCRWVTPRFYGAFDWDGGRALAFSYEGTPLAGLGFEFSSLGLIRRCVPRCFQA